MYLTRAAVSGTLDALAAICGSGSVLAMDFWQHVGGRSVYGRFRGVGERAIRLIGEPIGFSIAPSAVAELVGGAVFDVVDLATADGMTRRYATAGRHCDEGMYVVAARLR